MNRPWRWALGNCSYSKWQIDYHLQMDLQNKTCHWCKHKQIKSYIFAKDFSQKEGIDYEETLAPITRYTTIWSLVLLVDTMRWNIHQMDVKTTFINGNIDEEVYIEQLESFEINNRDTHVCRLKKSLYPLNQAPRAWYKRMDAYLLRIRFVKIFSNANLYIKIVKNEPVVFITCVECRILECKKMLATKFVMKYFGLMHY